MRIILTAGIALLVFTAQAAAQDADLGKRIDQTLEKMREKHYETTAGLSLTESSRILYGGYVTLSYLHSEDTTNDRDGLRQADGKFWTEIQHGGHLFYGRVRVRYQDFDNGDGFFGEDHRLADPIGDRYWYKFDWRTHNRTQNATDTTWNWWVQVGRMYVQWISGMVLSDTLYAVRPGADIGQFRIQAIIGWTPPHSFIDFDASRPNYDSDTERMFWGIAVIYHGFPEHRPYVYVIGQEDDNNTTVGAARWGYDSRYVAIGSSGQLGSSQFSYRVEWIYEFGDAISDILGVIPQTIDDISAWAARIHITFVPFRLRQSWRARFEFELLLGSGDSDRLSSNQQAGGNTSLTDDESFNAFGYTNTGLSFAPELGNIISIRLGASTMPFPSRELLRGLRFGVDVFFFNKMDDMAPVSVTTIPGQGFLGVEVDLVVTWNVTSDTNIDIRYGAFFPDSSAFVIDNTTHFFYAGVSYGF